MLLCMCACACVGGGVCVCVSVSVRVVVCACVSPSAWLWFVVVFVRLCAGWNSRVCRTYFLSVAEHLDAIFDGGRGKFIFVLDDDRNGVGKRVLADESGIRIIARDRIHRRSEGIIIFREQRGF
jgi:hypothetical protein